MSQFTGSILKADSFGRVERLDRDGEQVLRRVASGGRWPMSATLARSLLRRERRALEALAGLAGFPALLHGSWGEVATGADGTIPRPPEQLVRQFLVGAPLHLATELPANFFDRLDELVERMHTRGVCHNDLHKEQNILVALDGFPNLIDFQLASVHRTMGRTYRVRCHEDRRHVQKHRLRYLRDGRGPQGYAPPTERLPRKPLSKVWRRTGKPIYHFVTRKLLRRWDGEARRISSGPWPRWTEPLPPWSE